MTRRVAALAALGTLLVATCAGALITTCSDLICGIPGQTRQHNRYMWNNPTRYHPAPTDVSLAPGQDFELDLYPPRYGPGPSLPSRLFQWTTWSPVTVDTPSVLQVIPNRAIGVGLPVYGSPAIYTFRAVAPGTARLRSDSPCTWSDTCWRFDLTVTVSG